MKQIILHSGTICEKSLICLQFLSEPPSQRKSSLIDWDNRFGYSLKISGDDLFILSLFSNLKVEKIHRGTLFDNQDNYGIASYT